MPFLLLLDEDVPILLSEVLRQRGYDVVHATETGLSGASDERVLDGDHRLPILRLRRAA